MARRGGHRHRAPREVSRNRSALGPLHRSAPVGPRAARVLRRSQQIEREDPRGDPDGLAGRTRRMKPSAAWKALKKYASEKPGAWEDHPWGETVYKIGKKVFVFLGHADSGYGMSCKLPDSSEASITAPSSSLPSPGGIIATALAPDHEAICMLLCCSPGVNTSVEPSARTAPRGK